MHDYLLGNATFLILLIILLKIYIRMLKLCSVVVCSHK